MMYFTSSLAIVRNYSFHNDIFIAFTADYELNSINSNPVKLVEFGERNGWIGLLTCLVAHTIHADDNFTISHLMSGHQ